MSLRFYRRLRIAPGFTLNLSKRGASVSAGVRGAHVTAGTHGTRETVGLPGTGVFYTKAQRWRVPPTQAASGSSRSGWGGIVIGILALGVLIGLLIGVHL